VEGLLEGTETDWPELLVQYSKALLQTRAGDATRQWFVSMGLEASLYAVQQTLIHMRDADQRDELASVRVPTAVFHGAHDAIVPFAIGEYLAENVDDAALVRFEKSGHAVWIDEKARFNSELTRFVEERVFGNVVPPPDVEKLPGGGERLPYKQLATRPRRGKPRIEGATGEVYE
jgi:pimeloyl-ACP methyl ester carboxylesterase